MLKQKQKEKAMYQKAMLRWVSASVRVDKLHVAMVILQLDGCRSCRLLDTNFGFMRLGTKINIGVSNTCYDYGLTDPLVEVKASDIANRDYGSSLRFNEMKGEQAPNHVKFALPLVIRNYRNKYALLITVWP